MKMQGRGSQFSKTGYLSPGKSVFDISYSKMLTCDMGQLIPVMCDEVVPGDVLQLGCQAVVRMQPMVAPVLHEINMYAHTFFVPYRILWNQWEDFITGGESGDSTAVLPRWQGANNDPDSTTGSLWDYLGLPVTDLPSPYDLDLPSVLPLDFPRRAYNLIYDEYYRDQNVMEEVDEDNESILYRCWEKDYFTSSLPWQQRGTAPAFPITGNLSAVFDTSFETWTGQAPTDDFLGIDPTTGKWWLSEAADQAGNGNNLNDLLNNNTVDLSTASTFDVADMRLAFQIQKFLERNARTGARYTEFLKAHFGLSPKDERLDRPEYIGGSKSPVIISEVLQTSSTDETTPQGNLAGHGLSVNEGYIGKYRVQEFGLVMTLMSIMPRSAYQQGINRQWLRETKYDFFFPEFANLSEQAISQNEVYMSAGESIFGYQGRYDEMRYKPNLVCGNMRDTFSYWHLGRNFESAPNLNEEFMLCQPRKDIFAVQDEEGFIVNFSNLIKAYRPIPAFAQPGLIDHN